MGYVATGLISRSATFGTGTAREDLTARVVTRKPPIPTQPPTIKQPAYGGAAGIIPKAPPLATGLRALFPRPAAPTTSRPAVTRQPTVAPTTRQPAVTRQPTTDPWRKPAPATTRQPAVTRQPTTDPWRKPAPATTRQPAVTRQPTTDPWRRPAPAPTRKPASQEEEVDALLDEAETPEVKNPPVMNPTTGSSMWGGGGSWYGPRKLDPSVEADAMLDEAEYSPIAPLEPPKKGVGGILLLGGAALAAAYAIWGA